jgi:hypothetical protein
MGATNGGDRRRVVVAAAMVCLILAACGTRPVEDAGSVADVEPAESSTDGPDGSDLEAHATDDHAEGDVADPDDPAEGEVADGLAEALVTAEDLSDELAPGPWLPGGFFDDEPGEPGIVEVVEDYLFACASEAWNEEDLHEAEREQDPPPPLVSENTASFGSEAYVAVTHTVDELDPAVAEAHISRLDEVAPSCGEWDIERFAAEDEVLGVARRLELDAFGDGSTAWRVVWFVPEMTPMYFDHVRWRQHGVLSTLTLTWSPVLVGLFGDSHPGVDPDADLGRVLVEHERAVLDELNALTDTLDRRLADVLAGR